MINLPLIDASDLDGVRTKNELIDRLGGILAEREGLLLDLTDDLDNLTVREWLQDLARRLRAPLSGLVERIEPRDIADSVAAFMRARSVSRAKGLPALGLAHDGRKIIRVEVPRDFEDDLKISIVREGREAAIVRIAVEEYDEREARRLMNTDDHGYLIRHYEAASTGLGKDRRVKRGA